MEPECGRRYTATGVIRRFAFAPLAAACTPRGEQPKALPKLQDAVNGELPEGVAHRHSWKSPGYATFGGS